MKIAENRTVGILLIIMGVIGSIASSYAVATGFTLHGTGNVSMTRAFWDGALTQAITTVDWGNVAPNSTTNKPFFIKNYGAQTVKLTLTVVNWNPSNAGDYMSVTWDGANQNILAGMAVQFILTLHVYENVTQSSIGAFSHDLQFTEAWS